MFLVDTNVISHIAPGRRRPDADDGLARWLVLRAAALWISVITAAEIEDGINKLKRTGARRKAADLEHWWGAIRHYYADRILPLDLAVAEETGRLLDKARSAGVDPGFEDLAIAATAKVHGLVLLTRNTKDFTSSGIECRNPFESLPD